MVLVKCRFRRHKLKKYERRRFAFTQCYFMYCPVLLLFLLLSPSLSEDVRKDNHSNSCILDVINGHNASSQSLLLTARNPPEFVYPSTATPTTVKIMANESARLICGSANLHLTCKDGRLITADGSADNGTTTMRSLGCAANRHEPKRMVKSTKHDCPVNVICQKIGFQINLFDFVTTIGPIYLNLAKRRPLFAHATILPIVEQRSNRSRNRLEQPNEYEHCETGSFFAGMSARIEDVFKKEYQKKRLAKVLANETLVDKYITDRGATIFQPAGEHLVRGQLIDREDLFYKPQQDSASCYANVMPMWRGVAEGNWRIASAIIRKIAADTRTSLEVWSGGIGTLELEDAKGVKRPVHLALDESGNEVVPVPKLLFKYVHEPSGNRGLVILTVNNPYLRRMNPDYLLCDERPLCYRLHPHFRIFAIGYTYCCSLSDFASIAKRRGLPFFPNAQPLW